MNSAPLPRDTTTLQAMVVAQQAEIEHLKLIIAKLRRMPLYRQSGIYAREGVDLERSTLADWVGQCSALLRPLVERLRHHVLAGEKLHADDTPVPVLAPGDGKTKTGRLWTYVRDDRPAGNDMPPAVWFAYSPNRKGEHPQTHLKSFKGILQADAFAGFDALYAKGDILEAACWAHARRKFFEIHQAQGSPIAAEALKRIAALYAIEGKVRGQPSDVRRKGREPAKPILDEFHAWLLDTRRQLSKKSGLADAIGYALNHWQALIRYLTRQEAACLIAQAQALRQDLADFIRLALHTGCRKNELLTLKWSDVHIDRRVILLRPEQTKANKRRAVPLNQTALQALDNLRQQNDTQWVFARRKNGKPGERIKALDWLFRKAVKQAGIEDFRIHDLRHTFASWLVSEGVELVKVRDLLGHTSIKMTERYAHLMPDRLLDAVQILDFPEAGK